MTNAQEQVVKALEDEATFLRADAADLPEAEWRRAVTSLADRRVTLSRRIIEAPGFSDGDMAVLGALANWCPPVADDVCPW